MEQVISLRNPRSTGGDIFEASITHEDGVIQVDVSGGDGCHVDDLMAITISIGTLPRSRSDVQVCAFAQDDGEADFKVYQNMNGYVLKLAEGVRLMEVILPNGEKGYKIA